MDGLLDIFIGGGLASLILEGIKWILRNWILKNPEFNFHPNFYLIAIPVLNVLLVPVAAFLQVEGATMPTDWASFARSAALILIQSLVTVLIYQTSIKPLKNYGTKMQAEG